MFQFRRFPSYTYGFSVWCTEVTLCGFLHSEICGSKLAYSSPQLIAVNHVLHRLPMPRHSPCAFVCFTFRALCSPCVNYEFFWLLVVYPNQNFHSDVVFAFQIFSGIVVFLIFALHLLFSFQGTLSVLLRTDFRRRSLFSSNPFWVHWNGPKWTRTTDLTLIRRAL